MVMLAAIGDAFIREDDASAREHLALALAATEQAASDERWDLAFFFMGEEPAPSVFAPRPSGASARMRAFTPLVPAGLGAVTLAYVREIDLLTQRRKEAVNPSRAQPQKEEQEKTERHPKRCPRFPRKPKDPSA